MVILVRISRAVAMILSAVLAAAAAETPRSLVDSHLLRLLEVKSIYVAELRGSDGKEQIRDMLIGSLQRTGLFVITESEERADAYLRGSAEDLIFMEIHRQRDGIQVRGSASSSERESGDSEFASSSFGVGDTGESYRRERKHEAMAAVRLVLRNGDVIWSCTEESAGAKYRGPSADVAEKVAKELVKAYEEAQRRNGSRAGEAAVR